MTAYKTGSPFSPLPVTVYVSFLTLALRPSLFVRLYFLSSTQQSVVLACSTSIKLISSSYSGKSDLLFLALVFILVPICAFTRNFSVGQVWNEWVKHLTSGSHT